MRNLEQSLQDHDLGHLRVIAELWGFDAPTGDARGAAATLAQRMAQPKALLEVSQALPPSCQRALARLLAEGGRLPWADFVQQFGEFREMGPGRRDREKPWRSPVSDTERLLYRGLIGRAFADTPVGPKEFAYIPAELHDLLPRELSSAEDRLGHPTGDPPVARRANTGLVDDATTLLADLRRRPLPGPNLTARRQSRLRPFLVHPRALDLLVPLTRELQLVESDSLQLRPARVGTFLAGERGEALGELAAAWLESEAWNDFGLLAHLEPGPTGWPNEPVATRRAALDLMSRLPLGVWWDLNAFLRSVKERHPSFCRPGGDFDSWYLRDRRTGAFLRGIDSWEAVDGALLRALLVGPLHWLGAVDLAAAESEDHSDRFRLTPWFRLLTDGTAPPTAGEEAATGRVLPDGRLEVPRRTPRELRYQLARLSSWLSFDGELYLYRLRPSSVQAAADQGLKPHHLRTLLNEASAAPLPPRLLNGLERLTHEGIEAQVRDVTLLQVEQQELLDQLCRGKNTGRFVLERLGPTAALVEEGAVDELIAMAAEAGLLIEPPDRPDAGERE